MGDTKKGTYVARPQPGKQAEERLQVLKEVLAGRKTVTDAAAELGLSRHRFQVLMNRSLQAMVAELEPGAPGRPKKPEREAKLEAEAERLRRENARMKDRVQNIDRLLLLAAETLKGRIAQPSSQTRTSTTSSTSPSAMTGRADAEDPDPDGAARQRLERVSGMQRLGLTLALAAAVAGTSPSTVRRQLRRRRQGEPLCRRRGPTPRPVDPAAAYQATLVVRELEGLIGADALAVTTGLSRRKAAMVKHGTLLAMERERQAACTRVTVRRPGVVRGFDQMYVWTDSGWRFLLIAADAAVPYRTSVFVAAEYDDTAVLAALERDMEAHGAPLVYRMDRAGSHRTPRVQDLLVAAGVLVLHGPPRCPTYYGQMERQNREHRQWLRSVAERGWRGARPPASAGGQGLPALQHSGSTRVREVSVDSGPSRSISQRQPASLTAAAPSIAAAALPALATNMLEAMNTCWPRRALGFRTAAQAWAERSSIGADERLALREEVIERSEKLTRALECRKDLALRLAIEQALEERGYLRQERGDGAN